MGNSQSQGADREQEGSSYNYHESVLRDARRLCNTNNNEGYESDDQYFSAEEGDESDRSITPLRTRPESSSGEDFSDDSVNDDDQGVENGPDTSHTQGTATAVASNLSAINDSQRFLSPGNRRVLMVKRRSGQVNNSSFLEHDSIGPELDRSRWDVSSNNNSVRTTRQSSQRSFTGRLSGLQQNRFSTSPFVPINSPPSSHNALQRSNARNSANTKRKADESVGAYSEDNSDASPKRRHVLRLSPNKRRLAMLDESDSDSSDNDDKPTSKKKGRHDFTGRQSEQSVIGQDQDINLKRSMNEDEDKSQESESPKKGKFVLRHKKMQVPGEKRNLEHIDSQKGDISARVSPQSKTFKSDNGSVYSELSHHGDLQPVAPLRSRRTQGSAFQPLNEGSNTAISQDGSQSVYQAATTTMKMGNDAVRNSLGKVLPIRYAHQNQTSSSLSCTNVAISSSSQPVQASHSDSVVVTRNQSLQMGNASGQSAPNIENDNISSSSHWKDEERNESPSPFQNVVLTPPSSSNAYNSQSLTAANVNFHEDAMETDESQSQSGMDSMETHPYTPSPRQMAAAKRNLTTAQRFKNFFSGSSLKSNFKTLFSKDQRSNRTEPHSNISSNQTSWSLYSSPSPGFIGQSPASLQAISVFQSTSSPIDTAHSTSNQSVNFSQNLSNVSTGPSSPIGHQSGRRQSTTPLSSAVKRKGVVRKSPSTGHVATRTSPRLNRSAVLSSTDSLDVSRHSQDICDSHSSTEDIVHLSQTSEFQVLHFHLYQTLGISLALGDIAEELSAGIVNWTDGALTHNMTDCSRRICAKAGALMRAGCNNYIENKDGVLEAPDVLTTPAGGRFPKSVKALLHVVSPSMASHARLASCLLDVNANCLRFASERLSLDSLSMPLIGEGELPTQLCAEAFIDAVLVFISEKKSPHLLSRSLSSSATSLPDNVLTSIHLVTADAVVTDQAADTIQARIDNIRTNDLANVVADIRTRYYGHVDSPLMGNADLSSMDSESNTSKSKVSVRAKSGRPLVKRPRL